MIKKLNRSARLLIAVFGGLFLILMLLARMDSAEDDNDGFQTREFDDIW